MLAKFSLLTLAAALLSIDSVIIVEEAPGARPLMHRIALRDVMKRGVVSTVSAHWCVAWRKRSVIFSAPHPQSLQYRAY
uniref:Secreted protein n=1 Tax=Timema cristinae TaxID=61476 RepID=A0A7R9CRP7_TIMCR|nr:unnamed protein product [Timema cristinae]